MGKHGLHYKWNGPCTSGGGEGECHISKVDLYYTLSLPCLEMYFDIDRKSSVWSSWFCKWSDSIICSGDTWTHNMPKVHKDDFPTVWLWPNAVKLPFSWCFPSKDFHGAQASAVRNPYPWRCIFTSTMFEAILFKVCLFLLHFRSVGQVRRMPFKQCGSPVGECNTSQQQERNPKCSQYYGY